VTNRGRTRRRLIPIDLNEILQGLNTPSPNDRVARQAIREHLLNAVGESTYAIWLEPIELIAVGNEDELVLAPHEQTASWVRERFSRVLTTCAQRVGRQARLASDTERRAIDFLHRHEPPSLRGRATAQKERQCNRHRRGNEKRGVGKTTTAADLGIALAIRAGRLDESAQKATKARADWSSGTGDCSPGDAGGAMQLDGRRRRAVDW
jgi:hypothetical protein